MEEENLQALGLTRGEAKVYIALLKRGSSTIGAILKEAGVSNSKVYDILERLGKKGLVGRAIINNRQAFEAKSPTRLQEYLKIQEKDLEEKRQKADSLIPALRQLQETSRPRQEAEILQGLKGIKTFSEMALDNLDKEDTFYILGAPKESNELLGGYFQDWHERRARKGIKCKILYNQDAREWAKRRTSTPLTEVRFLPPHVKTPALVDIGKNHIATIIFGKQPLCIVIQNSKVTESYKTYFKLLWKTARLERERIKKTT